MYPSSAIFYASSSVLVPRPSPRRFIHAPTPLQCLMPESGTVGKKTGKETFRLACLAPGVGGQARVMRHGPRRGVASRCGLF